MYSREFLRWKAYLERKWNEHTKLDYYLAQIAFEIRRMRPKAERAKLEHYLLKFKLRGEPPTKVEEPDDEAAAEKAARTSSSTMKAFFLGMFGRPVNKGP